MVRRVGHIRVFTAMVCLATSGGLAHALFLAPYIWWPLRAVTGFCFASLFMVIESWLNERSTNENRGTIFSIYTVICLTVLTAGQLMITLYDPATFPLFCLVAILISLAALPVALTRAQAPAPIATVKIKLGRLFNLSPTGFAGNLAVGLTNGSFWSLGPVFAQQSNMDIAGVAYFMSLTVIGGAVSQFPIGWASDRTDRRRLIVFTCSGAALSGVGLALFGHLFPMGILIFAFFFGALNFPIYALSVALTNDRALPDAYVETAGGLLVIHAVGAMIGPLLSSASMSAVGKDGLFLFSAATHAALAVFSITMMRRRASALQEEKVVFNESIRRSQTVAPLDL
jgi:MFS family permease